MCPDLIATTHILTILLQKEEIAEEKKAEEKKVKLGRRISSRIGEIFKAKPRAETATPAKVDENPPKIDEPEAVAPLENPAETEAAAEPAAEAIAAPIEAPAAAPVVAATA